MFIEFTVGNFLSFKEKRTLSFKAGSITELPGNVVISNDIKLLRSSVIYGANSSGKSNLIKALSCMRNLILSSVKLNDNEELDFTPFLLSDCEEEPTSFEIIFLLNNKKVRYGLEYNLEGIVKEWLYTQQGSKKEIIKFIRTIDGIGVTKDFKEGEGKEISTNDNRLFISLVAQLGGGFSKAIIEWIRSYNVISGLDHEDYNNYTLRMLHRKIKGCEESLSLFKKLQLGFSDVITKESEYDVNDFPTELSDDLKSKILKDSKGKTHISMKTIHNSYDEYGSVTGKVNFSVNENESEGTRKIIDLSGPIFDTLILGTMLIIDELDAKLHPLITIQIIKLFNSPETNPNNAQLLFVTHDTNLLKSELFRRDQIWFTEKDNVEQTDLYNLIEFKMPDGSKVRSDGNLERNYIRGRYGAIPFITL